MKWGTTLFLKVVVILIGLPALLLCVFWLPSFIDYLGYPIVVAVYGTAIAYIFALIQAFKLLTYIDKNKAFSYLSVNALKNIKYSAIAISAIYAVVIPFLIPYAQADDSPGLAGIPMIITFGALVIAVFAAVLQILLKEAIAVKSEHDLTV